MGSCLPPVNVSFQKGVNSRRKRLAPSGVNCYLRVNPVGKGGKIENDRVVSPSGILICLNYRGKRQPD